MAELRLEGWQPPFPFLCCFFPRLAAFGAAGLAATGQAGDGLVAPDLRFLLGE